ncbi:hypothetical protein BS333_17035 [Vibrio azureus]|uniref:Uncharacterized protein n=1 Tax=Vibrio azureus NBRC 104587 TaxID=1219077 RepID=U3ACL1_9VIBR|nr:hypothetical protein [Vibrio azureus]AUI88077.1 hypothetical protein BS333_17035 [Vibrio azureus]GAD77671.1 hypothetical protein VAZ01S_085_00170 [Vibrio azureus NBRC 104587]
MDLKLSPSSDEIEIFLFECVVKNLQSFYGHSYDDAVRLVNEYYAKFTDAHFCRQHGIPVQTADLFSHIAAAGMADRVQYYQGLKNDPNERALIEWQWKMVALRNV